MSVTSSQSYSSSSRLLTRARQNDPEAWENLLQLYGPLVYRWARQAGLQPQDSTDMVQEVFQSVLLSFDSFNLDSFRGWLWIITRNHLYTWFRKQSSLPTQSGDSTLSEKLKSIPDILDLDHDPDEENSKALLLQRALDLIRSDFEDETWIAFWQLAIEKKPVNEIADSLNMSPGAVRQAKYRILLRLREEIGRL